MMMHIGVCRKLSITGVLVGTSSFPEGQFATGAGGIVVRGTGAELLLLLVVLDEEESKDQRQKEADARSSQSLSRAIER